MKMRATEFVSLKKLHLVKTVNGERQTFLLSLEKLVFFSFAVQCVREGPRSAQQRLFYSPRN